MSDLNEINKLQEEVQKNISKTKGIGLFFTDKEKAFFTESGREITEDILQTSFLFYKIDLKKTRIHPLYGESKNKHYLPPVEIFGRINVEVNEPSYQVKRGLTKKGLGILVAHIYIEHLRELNLIEKDQGNIIISSMKGGDFISYKGQFYKIYDDGYSQISNQHSYGGDRRFYLTIKAFEVDEDVMQGR